MIELTTTEQQLADKGEVIPCIRSIRARTHCGFPEGKRAYDAYLALPKEQVAFQRQTIVDPQGNDYGCAFCTLEYLTGVSRDIIAMEIGHDGSEIIDPEAPKPFCHATLTESEFNYWLFLRGYQPTSLITYEFVAEHYRKTNQPFYAKRFHPSVSYIRDQIKGKAVELVVESQRYKGSHHSVAFLDSIVLDPRDGCVHQLYEYNIVGVTFTNIDAYQRLAQIHAAQPREKVTTV